MRQPAATVVLRNQAGTGWLRFKRFRRIFIARRPEEVVPSLCAVEKAVDTEGLYAAGFLSYEAAPAFDSCLCVKPDTGFPLAWFALFDKPEEIAALPACSCPGLERLSWRSTVTPQGYRTAISRIKNHISRGDTYQVNFTYRLHAACAADPWQLFLEMAAADDPPFGAFIDTGEWAVCSASPELFFKLRGSRLESRPMKGTAGRGLWPGQDKKNAGALAASPKDRAENIMIADMVRNDLGRVAVTGSVQAPRLFTTERYPTVWQMTSTVRAATRASIADIFKALFPPASITGAPRASTMQIIAGLEASPRRIYTGAIGCIAPGRAARFSVAIRTLLVDRLNSRAEYGVGGGIVWDSKAQSEFAESRLKARVLRRPQPAFDLLETLLWTPERGFWLLAYHIRRLRQSADYYSFNLNTGQLRLQLEQCAARLPGSAHRIRLLLSKSGAASLSAARLEPGAMIFSGIALAPQPLDAANPFLYHKTTCRQVYEDALNLLPGAADVLLYNQKGEITESTIANIAVDLGGCLCTPPLRCGLLPGTLRAYLLDRGQLKEKAITIEQLTKCRRTFLLNSVRGMQPVKMRLSGHE